jgi:ethanolamine utilization protein EutA (predicted chaperonin)
MILVRLKSFLSFLDSKIMDNITSLGVSIGTDIEQSIVSMKEVELNRLLQTPLRDLNHKDLCQSSDDNYSEVDSDLGLDHKAIQHLM